MAASKRGLVDKVKRVVARASTRGAMTLVEGTAAAVRTVDKLQQKLASRRKPEETDTQAKASEVSAPARKARAPAPEPKRPAASRTPARTSGRKTMAAEPTAAKRTKAPAKKKAQPGEFKVKRGQKHLHSGR